MSNTNYQEMFTEALQAGARRDYGRAVDLLLRIVGETDRFPQAYLYLGRAFHAVGRLDSAIQYLHYFVKRRPEVAAGHFFLGRSYLALDVPRTAVRHLRHAVELEPDNVQPLALLGLCWLKLRRPDTAIKLLGHAVELDPQNRVVYAGYLNTLLVEAIRQFRDENRDMARQMFAFLVDQRSGGIVPLLYLAAIAKAAGDYTGALRHYDAALLASQDDPMIKMQRADVLYRLGQRGVALKELQNSGISLGNSELHEVDVYRLIAIQSFHNGRHRKAAEYAKRVLRRVGPNAEMHTLMGESLRKLGMLKQAKNHFTRAIERNRKNVDPHLGLALALWQLGEWRIMLNVLSRIETLKPENGISGYYTALCYCKLEYPVSTTIPAVIEEIDESAPDKYLYTALADQYARAGRLSEAETWYRKALAVARDYAPAHDGLLDILLSSDRTMESIAALSEYLEYHPEDTDGRYELIQLLVQDERYQEALEHIRAYIPSDRSNEDVHRLMGYCLRQTGSYREAAGVYRQLLKEQPDNEDYLRALCYCLDHGGNRAAAVRLIEKALEHFVPRPSLLVIYGVLLYKEDQLELALQQFRQASEQDPDDWRAYKNMSMVYRKLGVADMADRYFSRSQECRSQPH